MRYQPIEQLKVFIDFGMKKILVGQLVLKGRKIWFNYDSNFVGTGFEISPFQLPLSTQVVSCQDNIFEGLFGVFSDSLPDGWGRLLLDRQVRSHGLAAEALTPLDRLSYVGQFGMGALCYQPDLQALHPTNELLNLEKLAEESRCVLEGNENTFFEELLFLNGSSCGARPKIVAAVSQDKKTIRYGEKHLPTNFQHWLIKFPASRDPNDIGAIEYAYSLMAKHAGIKMPETYLFSSEKNNRFFAVKRFDRQGDDRLYLHTLSGLIHADYRIANLDYTTFLKATYMLTKDITELESAYRLAVFNVLSHNRDDHSKNFSYLMDATGQWKLAPAYDLNFSQGPMGEHTMTVMGEGKNPSAKHLIQLAEEFSIKHSRVILEHVQESIRQWPSFAEQAGVSIASMQRIQKALLTLPAQ